MGQEASPTLEFTCSAADGSEDVRRIPIDRVVIAGWAGRNRDAIEAHIHELAEIGVKAPSTVPLFYRAGRETLTTASAVQVLGGDSSGEVEAVLIQDGPDLYVGVGSDHTDRRVEAYSIAVSKQVCPKPVSSRTWRFVDVAAHWDKLILRSFATIDGERQLYQEGTLDGLIAPAELFRRFGGSETLPSGTVMYGGTISVHGGIRPMTRFDMELEDPVLGRKLEHSYTVEILPVVS